jgi:outer membrane protein W
MARTITKGLLALLMFALPSLARAQAPLDPTALATPSAKPRVIFESLVGYGGVGFRGGAPLFVGDVSGTPASPSAALAAVGYETNKVSPRLTGDILFSYVYTENIHIQLQVGYGWNRLKKDNPQRYVITSVPMTLGARYSFLNSQRRLRPFVGAGAGMYVWSIQTRELSAAKDPITFERLRRADPGAYVTVGAERRMSKAVTATADIAYNTIQAKNTNAFPAGYNGNKSYFQARLGVNFFFSLSERLDQGLPE